METDIAIIGAGLTGLTTGFLLKQKGRSVRLFEKTNRTGGQIQTHSQNGFTFESGPNTGVVSYPEVAELFQLLADKCKLETADEASKKRLIWKKDMFVALPSSLGSAISTPLFTWKDKFRILGEPFRRKGDNPDETVGELTQRRLGKSFLQYAVDPFVSGVYAGDPMKLVTRYALPKLYNLEHEYGSFIRGAVAKARIPKTDRDRLASKKVFSAVGGLGRLTESLTSAIGTANITLNANDVVVTPNAGKWIISWIDGTSGQRNEYIAKKVVTTSGSYTLPMLLPFISKQHMQYLNNLHYAPILQASVGIKDTEDIAFKAFGGLVPSCERREILGILFPSACFKDRAPKEGSLFSFFVGGVKHSDMMKWPDEEIEELIDFEMHSMLKFPEDKKADMIRIFRHFNAIPQYEKNSGIRFKTIEEVEKEFPGLTIGGNLKDGIGMADRIKQATNIANKLCLD